MAHRGHRPIADGKGSLTLTKFLVEMIDHCPIMNRSQWAAHLQITRAALSQWVSGKNVPRPDRLLAIIDFGRRSDSEDVRRLMAEFDSIANEPIEEVAQGVRGAKSLNEYLSSAAVERFVKQLMILPASSRLCKLQQATALLTSESAISSPSAGLRPDSVSYLMLEKGASSPEAINRITKRMVQLLPTRGLRMSHVQLVRDLLDGSTTREVLEPVMILAARDVEEIELDLGQMKLELSRETPSNALKRVRPIELANYRIDRPRHDACA